jgi:hypothetical protein
VAAVAPLTEQGPIEVVRTVVTPQDLGVASESVAIPVRTAQQVAERRNPACAPRFRTAAVPAMAVHWETPLEVVASARTRADEPFESDSYR